METLLGLYRIMIGVSAGSLLLGIILLTGKFVHLSNSRRHLYFLGIANLASMLIFLFDLKISDSPGWKEATIFTETSILTLNMVLAYFVYISEIRKEKLFSNQVKQLFFFTFLSVCFYVSAYFIFGGSNGILRTENKSFQTIFLFTLTIFSFGSFYPMLGSTKLLIQEKIENKELHILLILNGINNSVGLVFYLLKFPNEQVSLLMNIVFNLVFSYYLSYYSLSIFFEVRKKMIKEKDMGRNPYSWRELKIKLQYWDDVKSYLGPIYPELIETTDKLPLSDLEKIHYVLKFLQIKAKDAADALNVSVKAVEMSRYRINKKLVS
ncbi:MAG: hypothetical protein EP305_01390 [Bacteroidetes bacterium]|nr:MAG: hypothetical protein EP305_01390 [Bacteroidota bacterium]